MPASLVERARASSLVETVPRNHRDPDAAVRRRVVAWVFVAGAGLLGASLSAPPRSRRFYGLTLGLAATWAAGGAAAGPQHLGRRRAADGTLRRPVWTPVATGIAVFAPFYGFARLARHVPPLDRALASVLRYADGGSPLVLVTTLVNGAAEEVFFRGAVYAAVGERHPVTLSTAGYVLATTATRNPALVLASGVMGTVFGLQRRASGGIQAPLITHLTWSALMLRYLPPLFADQRGPPPRADAPSATCDGDRAR